MFLPNYLMPSDRAYYVGTHQAELYVLPYPAIERCEVRCSCGVKEAVPNNHSRERLLTAYWLGEWLYDHRAKIAARERLKEIWGGSLDNMPLQASEL